jgi:hypothetical protein
MEETRGHRGRLDVKRENVIAHLVRRRRWTIPSGCGSGRHAAGRGAEQCRPERGRRRGRGREAGASGAPAQTPDPDPTRPHRPRKAKPCPGHGGAGRGATVSGCRSRSEAPHQGHLRICAEAGCSRRPGGEVASAPTPSEARARAGQPAGEPAVRGPRGTSRPRSERRTRSRGRSWRPPTTTGATPATSGRCRRRPRACSAGTRPVTSRRVAS